MLLAFSEQTQGQKFPENASDQELLEIMMARWETFSVILLCNMILDYMWMCISMKICYMLETFLVSLLVVVFLLIIFYVLPLVASIITTRISIN